MAAHNRGRKSEAEEARERSSSDEEEEESTEENEDVAEESDTESEGDKNNQPPPKKQLTPLPQHHSSSDDDDDTESDSQSDAIPNSVPEVKLVSSKPVGDPSKASKKSRSKSSTDVIQPPVVSSKRPADSPVPKKGNDSKRAKKNKEQNADETVEYESLKSTGEDSKRQIFQRIWSEDDEIVILKGMIEHAENQGIDPASVDMISFYDFIRKSLHIEASKSQLTEKIRRLKKKYQTSLKKSNNGDDRTFPKAHDQACYDLSKQIWGTESNENYSAKVSKKGKNVDAKAKKTILDSPIPERSLPTDKTKGQKSTDMEVDQAVLVVAAATSTPLKAEPFYRQPEPVESSLEMEIVKLGSQLITGAKKLELDDKLKKLQMKEIEVYLQRLDYKRELSALVLEAWKSSTN